MVAQSPNAAIANADAYTRCEPAMCLKYVRTWLEIPSREADAQGAWDAAQHKHPGDRKPPEGGYGGGYGEKVVQAVEYWISHLDGGEGMGGPKDGSQVNNGPANRLFGPNYNVIEE
jgi:hypothetical protein